MDDKLVRLVLMVSVTLMSAASHSECGLRDLCEVQSQELPHTENRVPAQQQTVAQVTTVTPGSSRAGTYFAVMPT